MKKSAILLATAGLMILSEVHDVEAFRLFGHGKTNKATSKSIETFGINVVPLRKAVDALKKAVAAMRKAITSASSQVLRDSMEVKAYSEDVQVAVSAYLSVTLDNIAAALDIMDKNLKMQSDGLNEIAVTKTGGAHLTKGKTELKMATDLSEIGEQLLAVTETNIVFLLNVINNATNRGVPVINRGKLATTIGKLQTNFEGTQRQGIMQALQNYLDQLEQAANMGNSIDRFIRDYYNAAITYTRQIQQTFSLYAKFLACLKEYVSTNNSGNLENFIKNNVRGNLNRRLQNVGYVISEMSQDQRNAYRSQTTGKQRREYIQNNRHDFNLITDGYNDDEVYGTMRMR